MTDRKPPEGKSTPAPSPRPSGRKSAAGKSAGAEKTVRRLESYRKLGSLPASPQVSGVMTRVSDKTHYRSRVGLRHADPCIPQEAQQSASGSGTSL